MSFFLMHLRHHYHGIHSIEHFHHLKNFPYVSLQLISSISQDSLALDHPLSLHHNDFPFYEKEYKWNHKVCTLLCVAPSS